MSLSIHEKAAVGFDRAGDSYERGRPEYPPDAVDFLFQVFDLKAASHLVDLGAGTGKFTKCLATTTHRITAVEPVPGMRKKFRELFPEIKMLQGSAEQLPLASQAVDAVFVAQSFHWFHGPRALKEIHRVLKPDGHLGLIWNARDESLDWVSKLTDLIDPHEGGAPRFKKMQWRECFSKTQLFTPLVEKSFSYIQVGTVETFVDRVGSISFISTLATPERESVLQQVRELLASHPQTRGLEQIELPYRTHVYWCTARE